MVYCVHVSDLHGVMSRYDKLFELILREKPKAVFLGGDLLPSGLLSIQLENSTRGDFLTDFMSWNLRRLRRKLGLRYPRIFVIMGNDDPRVEEVMIEEMAAEGLWECVHFGSAEFGEYRVFGYSYIPPTPFLLKDWERYDVSRYVDPGSVSPEEGCHSIAPEPHTIRYSTIKADLDRLAAEHNLTNSIFLFHAPPYKSKLDRAALDGRMIDHVPLDIHVGSIAIDRFIEKYQPLVTLHGHIHESTRLTGSWRDRIGRTHMFNAAHDGPELSVVKFSPADPGSAERELL